MKKRFFSILAALSLLIVLPCTAYAASGETSQSTSLSVTVEEPAAANTYTVTIPSSLTIEPNQYAQLSCSAEADLADNKKLLVELDPSCLSGNKLLLYKDKGQSSEASVEVSATNRVNSNIAVNADDRRIAQWSLVDGSLHADITPGMEAIVYTSTDTPAGTYTGNVTFKISVQDK